MWLPASGEIVLVVCVGSFWCGYEVLGVYPDTEPGRVDAEKRAASAQSAGEKVSIRRLITDYEA